MEKGDGTEIIYLYNADGQRVFKKVDDTDGEHYIMDGSVNVAIFTENGSLTHWNMLADGVSGRVKPIGDKVYYLKDHLGSTRAVINETGGIQESHDYYPFGLVMPGRDFVTGSPTTKELFTGKERDEETGLDYFGARYYDASIGRWLSPDPYDQYSSTYVYTGNNPVGWIDFDGRFATESFNIRLEWYFDENSNLVAEEGDNYLTLLAFFKGKKDLTSLVWQQLLISGQVNDDGTVDEGKGLDSNTIGKVFYNVLMHPQVQQFKLDLMTSVALWYISEASLSSQLLGKPGSTLTIRSDIVLKGGRSGELVKSLTVRQIVSSKGAWVGYLLLMTREGLFGILPKIGQNL